MAVLITGDVGHYWSPAQKLTWPIKMKLLPRPFRFPCYDLPVNVFFEKGERRLSKRLSQGMSAIAPGKELSGRAAS